MKKSCGYYYTGILTTWNNADSTAKAPDASGVLAKALLLKLTLDDSIYTCYAPCLMLPINTAYAFSCRAIPKMEKIDSFSILSDHDFDTAHPAGKELKDLFKYYSTDKNGEFDQYHAFYLSYNPTDTGTHTFTIKLYAANSSRNLSITALPVKLLL
jgi:hypothetical protein